jgi:hypothetical protein
VLPVFAATTNGNEPDGRNCDIGNAARPHMRLTLISDGAYQTGPARLRAGHPPEAAI